MTADLFLLFDEDSTTPDSEYILCPIAGLSATFHTIANVWGTVNVNNNGVRQALCSRRITLEPPIIQKIPYLFTIEGQFMPTDFYFTRRGFQVGEVGENLSPLPNLRKAAASFWFEARPNIVSRKYWRSARRGFEEIAQSIRRRGGGELDTTRLFRIGADDRMQLQLIWVKTNTREVNSIRYRARP